MPPNSQLSNNSLPKKHHWVFIVLITLLSLLFLGAAGFGMWAFTSRQDYKNNTDKKIAAAADIAKKQEATTKDNEFVEKEKLPLKHYSGPSAYGSIDIQYPKTWSAYVVETTQSGTPVEGYFHPGFVPSTTAITSNFALRLEVTSTPYDQELKKYDSQVKINKVKITPYKSVKVPSVSGVRIDGAVVPNKQGSMIMLPMRDKTLKIWTEASDFVGDFTNNILPNFTFVP